MSFIKYAVCHVLWWFEGIWDMPGGSKKENSNIWTHQRPDWLYRKSFRLLFQQYSGLGSKKCRISRGETENNIRDSFTQNRLDKLMPEIIVSYITFPISQANQPSFQNAGIWEFGTGWISDWGCLFFNLKEIRILPTLTFPTIFHQQHLWFSIAAIS